MKLGGFFKKLDRAPEGCASRAVTLADNRPEWLQDAIREAHCSDLPRDWIYQECEAACDAIDDGSLSDDDSVHEHADGRVDTYTKDRFEWSADMCLTDTFAAAESDLEDMGGESSDMTDRIGRLQYCAIARIARIMLEAWHEHEDDGDEESVEA